MAKANAPLHPQPPPPVLDEKTVVENFRKFCRESDVSLFDWRDNFGPRFQTVEAVSLAWHAMVTRTLQHSKKQQQTVHVRDFKLSPKLDPAKIFEAVDRILCDEHVFLHRPLACVPSPHQTKAGSKNYWHKGWEGPFVCVVARGQIGSDAEIDCVSYNDEILALIQQELFKLDAQSISAPPPKGLFMLIQTQGGLDFEFVEKQIGKPLVEENYSEPVVEGYRDIVKRFVSEVDGKLVILEGPPGTGKTHMVYAFIDAFFNSAIPVMIPASMVHMLGSPNMLPLLRDKCELYKQPLLLVLEDADNALATRSADNMSTISTILGMTDGLLSEIADVRIIATTNANNSELDAAVQRKRRLFKQMHIAGLRGARAKAVFEREHPGVKYPWDDNREIKLAELYSGELDSASKKRQIGYSS